MPGKGPSSAPGNAAPPRRIVGLEPDPITRSLVELYLAPLGYSLDWIATLGDMSRQVSGNGTVAFLLGATALPDLEPERLRALGERLGGLPLLGMAGAGRRFPASAVPGLVKRVLSKPIRADDLLSALDALQSPPAAEPGGDGALAGLEAMAREMEMDAAMIADLCQSFLQRGQQYLAELAAAADPRDDVRLDRIAHGFKGMAGNLRFHRLTELADDLRRAAKEHTGDPAALNRLLRGEFETMRARIEERWLLGARTELQE